MNWSSSTQRFRLSAFKNAWDNRPAPRTCTLPMLIGALTCFPVIHTANKLALPAWAPAAFKPNATRSAGAVETVSCVVLDFDAGDPDVVLAAWPGVLVILHTTWSHATDAARFRLVIPLAAPVPNVRWADAWIWAAARSPGCDAACKDPSRLYFRPAIPRAGAPHFARVEGERLLDLLGKLPPPRVQRSASPCHSSPLHTSSSRDADSRERVATELGARIVGEGEGRRATGVDCPGCRRPSVWFYVSPIRLLSARCNHRNSCGWYGGVGACTSSRSS